MKAQSLILQMPALQNLGARAYVRLVSRSRPYEIPQITVSHGYLGFVREFSAAQKRRHVFGQPDSLEELSLDVGVSSRPSGERSLICGIEVFLNQRGGASSAALGAGNSHPSIAISTNLQLCAGSAPWATRNHSLSSLLRIGCHCSPST